MEYIQLTMEQFLQEEQAIKEDIKGIVKNFVRTGWRLSRIDKSGAYRLKGYTNITEYARAQFGMTPDGVSRFINVYEKYSIPGDTPELKGQYRDFNFSQLKEMLTLPEEDAAMIRPEASREDIRELKRFNKENRHRPENLASWKEEPEGNLEKAVLEFFHGRKESLNALYASAAYQQNDIREMSHILMQNQKKTFRDRNTGIFMILYEDQVFVKGSNQEPEDISWGKFFEVTRELFDKTAAGDRTWETYFEPEIAPEQKRETEDEQIPGQDSIMNHPEYMPGKLHGKKFGHCIYHPEEDCISEDCGFCRKKRQKGAGQQEERDTGRATEEPEARAETGSTDEYGKEAGGSGSTEGAEGIAPAQKEAPERKEDTMQQEGILPKEGAKERTIKAGKPEAWPDCLSDIPVPSRAAVQDILEEKERELKDYLACEGLPERTILRQQLITGGLRIIRKLTEDILEDEQEEPEQPPLPKLRNNDQRKEFLNTFHGWPIWFTVREASETYYRYNLPDGSSLVICEQNYYAEWKEKYTDMDPECTLTREYLLKPGYRYLKDCLCSRTILAEHLKEVQRNGKN